MPAIHNSPGTNKKEFLFGARYQIVKDQSADSLTARGDHWSTDNAF
jgi:hypothetical protein